MKKPFRGEINNWKIVPSKAGEYYVITGIINDQFIITSPIVSFNTSFVETENSIYLLRDPSNEPR